MDGENAKDSSGISVHGLGDINGDGINDFIIGAAYYPLGANKGRSYVVFGSVNVGGKGVISLSGLNGTNGFKLDGEKNNDNCGHSVNTAGDVNGDGYSDLAIGAWSYPQNNQAGATYVVFGQPNINGSGLSLSKFNGTDGFKFQGENLLDQSGFAVGSVGDFNGDGVDDLYSSASSYPNGDGRGCGYIIFGTTNLKASGIFNITNLTGVNGFKILGENNGDYCGWGSISRAGDMNGDGVVDLVISAHHYKNSTGRAYVIFGDIPPVLVNNRLNVTQGEKIIIDSDILLAVDENHNSSQLFLIIENIQHGRFAFIDVPDQPVTVFSQEMVLQNQIIFQHDNSISAPSYSVAINSTGLAFIPAQPATIDFDAMPILLNNNLQVIQGETVSISSNNLSAIHPMGNNDSLLFNITEITHGRFHWLNNSLTSLSSFYQSNVTDEQIQFSHDNSTQAPAYHVSVTDGRITLPSTPANVTFYLKPMLTQNQFLVSTGQPTILMSSNLEATLGGNKTQELQFVVSSVSQGRFEQRSNPGIEIRSFYQNEIMQQDIRFIADNSTQPPDCRLKVLDNTTGVASDEQESGVILVINNDFQINQGEIFALTENALKTSSNRDHDEQIIFTPIVGTVQHGHFALAATPSYVLNSFQQSQIYSHDIVFVPDGSAQAPSAYLMVMDGSIGVNAGTLNCQVDFDTPPMLQHAYLKTSTSEKIKMTDLNLKAVSDFVASGKLIFEISTMKHGYFADNNNWNIELSNFTQQQITDNQIVFITDDSGMTPEFQVSVWDGRLHCQTCPQSAQVVFNTSNSSNSSLSDVLKNAIISAVASGVVGLLFFALRYKHSLSLQRNARPTIDGEEQETYPDTLLLPIAREIFSRIKVTGCLGYIGKRDYNEYIGAVSTIVAALETKRVMQPDHWNSLPRPQKQRIIDAIAMHTKELVGNNRCCSTRTFTSFYKAEATPRMIRDQAETIADAVQETLLNRTEAKGSRSRSSVRLSSASSSLNQSQMKTPLLS